MGFLHSYTARDRAWAEWIAWQLEAADFRVLVQAWDMVAGSNWSAAMQDGIRYSTRTLAVLSEAYLDSVYGRQEWQAAFVADPDGAARRLLPVRIENCERPGVLGSRVSVDLFGLAAHGARDVLHNAVQAAISGRAKPPAEPHFPGGGPIPPKASTGRRAPIFPGIADGPPTTPITPITPTGLSVVPSGSETPGECRALLIGVPGYDDEELPSLPWLAPLIDATAESLERVGYRADVHDRSRLGHSAIKSAIHAFLRDAAADDTLLLVLAGHGVHHDGRDFLVPADADLGYQPFWDLCVPLDWSAKISRSAAGRVLVLVDAADDFADAEVRAAVAGDGWATGRLAPAAGTDVAYLIRETPPTGAGSPLLRALLDVLSTPAVPANVQTLAERLRHRLAIDGSGDPVAGPVPCTLRSVLHCDPRAFRPFPAVASPGSPASPEHPWRRAADRHVAWTLVANSPAAEELRTVTVDLVGRLGAARDHAAMALQADSWLDSMLALRLMKRIEFLVRRLPADPPPLSPAEAGLLIVVPFLHETLWTTLVAGATVAHPGVPGPGNRLSGRDEVDRAEFENFTRLHPRLLRRIDRTRRTGDTGAAEAIGWWLAHRWVARRPASYRGPALAGLLVGIDPDTPAGEVFTAGRASALLTAIRADPAHLNRPGQTAALRDLVTVAPATGDEMTLRERLVGYLVTVGQRMALEPAALPDVIVEHLGVGDPVDLGLLGETIRGAQWQHRGRSSRALSARCQHQAVQVALERHTAELDSLLAEAHRAAGEIPALAYLPTHATAEAVRAVEVDGRPAYSSAGAQFRLAEDKVQELLMGEQLYANRGLAIRELYQNALDACRYRRAREQYLIRAGGRATTTWTGRITFTQGFEPDGGAYLECRDNGIGMGLRELTDVFAEAGTRSVDLPEVVEEMVAWKSCDPPIEFHPNSRFGVGVLSYFMIADEITIDTCRLGLDGRPGDRFRVTIAGPGNLFRVQNLGPGSAAGTNVRLHLSREVGKATVSCVDLLRRILWVAEFETEATEGVARAHWPPGELADSAPVGDDDPLAGPPIRRWTAPIVPGGDGVWWANGPGAVLADGLWVGRMVFGLVVNLTGELTPELSVDRNEIRELVDEAAIDDRITTAVPTLLAAGAFDITQEWLSALARDLPLVADAVLRALLATPGRTWPAAGGTVVPIEQVGCFPLDGELLPVAAHARVSHGISYRSIPDSIIFRRLAAWSAATVAAGDGPSPSASPSLPSDFVLAGWWNDRFSGVRAEVSMSLLLFLAGRLRQPVAEIARRLRELGLRPAEAPAATVAEVTRTDRLLVTEDLDGRHQVYWNTVPLGHAMLAAQRLGLGLEESIRRFRALGLAVGPAGRAVPALHPFDLVLLSTGLTGRSPWLGSSRVRLSHVLRAALQTDQPASAIRDRLAALGYRVPPLAPEAARSSGIDAARIFNLDEDGDLGRRLVPAGFVLMAAARASVQPPEVAHLLAELGFPVALSGSRLAHLGEQESEMFARNLSRTFLQVGEPISRPAVWLTAQETSRPGHEVASLLRKYGFAVADLDSRADAEGRAVTGADYRGWAWLLHPIGPEDVLALAASLNRTPADTARLLDGLGVGVPELTDAVLTTEDKILFSPTLDSTNISQISEGGSFPIAHLLAAAGRLRRDPGELAARVRHFGIAIADPTGWNAAPLDAEDAALLARDVTLDGPWLPDGPVPTAHLLVAAARTGRSPADVARRLGALGFATEPVPDVAPTGEDARLLVDLLDVVDPVTGAAGWSDPSRAALLAAAHATGREPRDLARWLVDLGLAARGTEAPGLAWNQDLDVAVDSDDLDLLSVDIDAQGPWLADGPVPYGHLLAVAGLTGRRPADLAARLRELGFRGTPGMADIPGVDAVDIVLLARRLTGESPWLPGRHVLPRAHLLHAACVLGCDVAEVRDRYARLGFGVPDELREINRDARTAVTVAFFRTDAAGPVSEPISAAQVLGVAEFTRRSPDEVMALFTGLDLDLDGQAFAAGSGQRPGGGPQPTARDAILLSARLDGRGPWLGRGPVPLAHVIAAAGYLRWTPARVLGRLAALGYAGPSLAGSARDAFVDGADALVVAMLRDSRGRYVDRPFSRAEILVASYRLRWPPRRIVERLAVFGLPTPVRETFDR
ncbi:TIR domain-containing protein [Frankia sp. AiPs1]|uniref:wHTH domain-containing protein n=1 Tax=Frankia sp. AiPs1 TaxID=573493 RepID=UPI00204436BE|nr:TIR domain-containing protein [Frankia sp. AiPs1]MCM3922521.1 TIR domain-containing protein [Frankia sp. AiPs1]